MSSIKKISAEQLFREAFQRLKNNKPIILSADYTISQNNVAREASRDPTALKIARYPILIDEIKSYITSHPSPPTKTNKRHFDNRSRTITQKFDCCKLQRDKLSSIVASQNTYIEELQDEIDRLKSKKIVKL